MCKVFNKEIPAVPAIAVIIAISSLAAGFMYWHSQSNQKQQETNQIDTSQKEKKDDIPEAVFVPPEFLVSDEKILEYIGNTYCGILRNNVSGDGVYAKKLIKDSPDLFLSACSVSQGCSRGTTMMIYRVDRVSGLINTAWWSNVYLLAIGDPVSYMRSKINFEDIDGDGNLEIIQDITEMKCDSLCAKNQECCQDTDYCTGDKIQIKEEYQKKFKWDNENGRFLEIY